MGNRKCKNGRSRAPSPALPLAPSPLLPPRFPLCSLLPITRFVTRRLTTIGSPKKSAHTVSFNHRVCGYLRGPETLARALPI